METNTPYFSVVIPLFNKEKYVARALDGVLSQTFADYEIVLVDDGSTDASAQTAGNIIAGLKNARLIRQKNRGAGETRSEGMRLARGEWVAYLDADDLWLPNHLQELEQIAKACPAARMIATDFVEINEGETALTDASASEPMYCNYFEIASRHPGRVNSSNVAIHRTVPDVSGWFGTARSGQDLEYWVRAALDHPVALSSTKTSVYYRGNWGNMEKLAFTRTNHSTRICSLGDVSASLALLESRFHEEPSLATRSDIRMYVNGRLDNAIRMQFVRGNFAVLPALRKMKFPTSSKTSRILSGLTYLPSSLLATGHRLRAQLKERLNARR